MDTNTIQFLTNIGSAATQAAINEYTYWHFVNALVFLIVGISIIFISVILLRNNNDEAYPFHIPIILMLITGILVFASNVVNVLSPKAYAIHQLIIDIKH